MNKDADTGLLATPSNAVWDDLTSGDTLDVQSLNQKSVPHKKSRRSRRKVAEAASFEQPALPSNLSDNGPPPAPPPPPFPLPPDLWVGNSILDPQPFNPSTSASATPLPGDALPDKEVALKKWVSTLESIQMERIRSIPSEPQTSSGYHSSFHQARRSLGAAPDAREVLRLREAEEAEIRNLRQQLVDREAEVTRLTVLVDNLHRDSAVRDANFQQHQEQGAQLKDAERVASELQGQLNTLTQNMTETQRDLRAKEDQIRELTQEMQSLAHERYCVQVRLL
jgi:hypothetical protein